MSEGKPAARLDTKTVLAKGVELVVFVFGAFSGALKLFAPPEETNTSYAVFVCSFLALGIWLIISVLARNQGQPPDHEKQTKNGGARAVWRVWLGVAVLFLLLFLGTAFAYKAALSDLTYHYPDDNSEATFVRGTKLTTRVAAHPESRNLTPAQLVAKVGGPDNAHLVWTSRSIVRANMVLMAWYVALVVTLCSALFCLTEGGLAATKSQPTDEGQSKPNEQKGAAEKASVSNG